MSKLSEMIATLCPNGVEYKRFSEVCFYIRGVTYGKSQEIRNGEDGWKVLRANNITLSTNSLNYDDVKVISKNVKVKPAQLLRKGDILICAGSGSKEHVGKVAYISEDSDYTFGGFMAVVRAQNASVDTRYLYHVLTSALFINYLKSALNSTTINNLSNSVIGPFEFPLPPLPIQREIVQTLDNFANLTAELTAELAKRKKQYEHYRDMLLNFTGGGRYDKFGDENGSPHIEWKRLGEVAEIMRGGNLQKKDFVESGCPCIHYGQIYTRFGIYADKPLTYISSESVAKQKFARPGDIVMAVTSENVDDVCKCLAWIGEEPVAVSGHTAIIRHNQNPKYLAYYFHTSAFDVQKRRLAHGTKVIEVTPDKLADIKIPLPPLKEQNRIVAILDRFDALCNSLTEGLPAEIALRKKQYEYYRDKLLSFKEAS